MIYACLKLWHSSSERPQPRTAAFGLGKACAVLPLPTTGADGRPLSPTAVRGSSCTGSFMRERDPRCTTVAKHVAGGWAALLWGTHPRSPPLPQAGARAVHREGLWEVFSSDQWTRSGVKKTKQTQNGAEEQLASGSRRGPRGPAAKANKEAT